MTSICHVVLFKCEVFFRIGKEKSVKIRENVRFQKIRIRKIIKAKGIQRTE